MTAAEAGTVPPEQTGSGIVAVLGPRDSAAPTVAAALTAAAGPGPDVRFLVDARPGDAPMAAVLVVDAVCPVRPDDVEVARGVAARLPLVVALAGRVGSCAPEAVAEAVDVTSRRLSAAGVAAAVLVLDDGSSTAAARLLSAVHTAIAEGTGCPAPASAGRPGGGAVRASDSAAGAAGATGTDAAAGTVDWLLARRTEAITARSQSLRQDVQALRIEVVQDLHRAVRDLGGRAREKIGAAPRRRVAELVREISDDADAAVAGTLARSDQRADALIARHLGAGAPATPRIPPPTVAVRPGPPPRHRGEEMLVLLMGAAGGTGLGRMLLAPLADVPGLSVALVPLALLCGLALGWTTVAVRRTQTLRAHMIAAVTDRLAGLRSEVEQSLGSRVLAAEATVTDGFAHDPGPRITDLDRRIRRLRTGGTPAARTGGP